MCKPLQTKNEHRCTSHSWKKDILMTPKTSWVRVFGLMSLKHCFVRHKSSYIWHKAYTAFHENNTSAVKRQGGTVRVWGCFATSGPKQSVIIDGTRKSARYQKILKMNVHSTDCDLDRRWIIQQSTSECLKGDEIKVWEWPSQSTDFSLLECRGL